MIATAQASFFLNDAGDNKMLMLRAQLSFDANLGLWVATCEDVTATDRVQHKAAIAVFAKFLGDV